MSPVTARARIKTPAPEVIAERQRLENERSHLASASSVRYCADADLLVLIMRSGVTIAVPRRLIDELADAPKEILEKELVLDIGGDALALPPLDVDIAVSGLLRDLLGFNIQRLGGLARSEAKAAASRANGTKGGRPNRRRAA